MNLQRVWVIAANVFREVIRDRVLYLVGLFALVLLLASRLLPEISSVAAEKTFTDLGLAAIGVFGLVVTLFVAPGLVNKEIDKRTVFILISKPLSRAELILGKHLGLCGVLAVLLAAMAGIYILLLQSYQIAFLPVPLALSLVYLLLELALLTAFALLFGSATSSLLATLLTLAIYLTGHLSPDLVQLAKLTENPNLQRVVRSLYLVLPDLSRFNFRNESVYGILPSANGLITTALYGIAYTFVLLVLTSFIFSKREF